MGEHPVTYALQDRYARFLGEQIAWKEPQPHITEKLIHLEAVIRMFKHDWDADSVKPIAPIMRSRWGKRGAGVRAAMKVLLDAERPLSATELSLRTHEALGIDQVRGTPRHAVGMLLIRSLERQLGERLVMHEGRPRRWAVS